MACKRASLYEQLDWHWSARYREPRLHYPRIPIAEVMQKREGLRALAEEIACDEPNAVVPMNAKQLACWERLGRPQYLPSGYQAIRKICQKYMQVSRSHTARYTLNKLAEQAGATLEERQGMLMHSSPVTTQIYDKQLEHGTNKTRSRSAICSGCRIER